MGPKELARLAKQAEERFNRERRKRQAVENAAKHQAEMIETVRAFGGKPVQTALLPYAKIDVSHADTLAGVVYVIWPLGDVYVKIGITRGILARVAGIQTGNPRPLILVAAFYEGERGWTERRMHERFAAQRAVGEWFRLEGELEQWLRLAIEAAKVREESPIKAPRPFDGREVRGG